MFVSCCARSSRILQSPLCPAAIAAHADNLKKGLRGLRDRYVQELGTKKARCLVSVVQRLDNVLCCLALQHDAIMRTHTGFFCNPCDSGVPIQGARYLCSVCDMQLCRVCESDHDPYHSLTMFKVPVGSPQPTVSVDGRHPTPSPLPSRYPQ